MKNKTFLYVLLFIGALSVVLFFLFKQAVPSVLVAQVKIGPIRDSVTGNVKVHAAASFDLRSQANAMVEWVGLVPLGNPLRVDKNETLIRLNSEDLDLRMNRLLLDRQQFIDRKMLGSQLGILLQIKEKDLNSSVELASKENIPPYEVALKSNEFERLSAQYKLEMLGHEHFEQNFQYNKKLLEKEIEKRSIRSPIKGDFSSCLVAPGNQVFPGDIVGKVYSRERIIEVSLNEEEFLGLKKGLSAGVNLFALGSKIFDATVTGLSSTVDSNSGIRKLYLQLNEKDIELPVGSSGHAEIIKSEKTETLILPRKALVGDYVVLDKKGIAHFQKVLVGARNLRTIEVIKGVKKGDRVVVETPHILRNGERIQSTTVGF